jgi:hypothetical protein
MDEESTQTAALRQSDRTLTTGNCMSPARIFPHIPDFPAPDITRTTTPAAAIVAGDIGQRVEAPDLRAIAEGEMQIIQGRG